VCCLRKNLYLRDLDEDGRIILKLFLKKQDEGVEWIHVAQDKEWCRAAVNTVMNLRVPYKRKEI
jgi:hypothetical protein